MTQISQLCYEKKIEFVKKSTNAFQELKEEAAEKYGLRILTAWTFADDDRLKYQNDHAGANETSIVMAVRPELVDFGQVKENESNLIGIAGRHPVRESSVAYGNEILEYTMKTLISGIEKEYKILKESQMQMSLNCFMKKEHRSYHHLSIWTDPYWSRSKKKTNFYPILLKV